MPTVNELQAAFLIAATGRTGDIPSLTAEWLRGLGYTGTTNEMFIQFFQAGGATSGKFNEAAAQFFVSEGYTGTLPEMWIQFWMSEQDPFVPTDLTGLEFWYDQSDISTLWQDNNMSQPVTAVGQTVGAWSDKSGNARHARQTIAASRPEYQAGGLSFDGTDDWIIYSGSGVPAASPMTVFVVFKVEEGAGGATIVSMADEGDTDRYQRLQIATGGECYEGMRRDGVEGQAQTTATFDDGAVHVATGMETSSSLRSVWVDGDEETNNIVPVTPPALHNVSIGRLSDLTPSGYLDGVVMEVLVYDTALSTENRNAVEAYLMDKWNI